MTCQGACSCGCDCEPSAAATPEPIENAPGLDRIRYRVGHHSTVKAALLRGLSDHELLALTGLGARDDADPTIALADGFAALADVLTFYTERFAHESYLRTATERLSIVELSRLIGYRPAPGVAAEAWLAFTVEEARTLPKRPADPVQVHAGTQVQSVPGQDELPVTFETVAPIEARAEWNAIPPVRSAWPGALVGRTSLTLAGTGHRLAPGDRLLVLGEDRATTATSTAWEVRVLVDVDEDPLRGTTTVGWQAKLTQQIPVAGATIHVFRLRAPVFGHNAPDPRLLSTTGTMLGNLADVAHGTWNDFGLSTTHIDLDQAYPQVVSGGWMLVEQTGVATHLARVTGVTLPSRSAFGLSSKVTRVTFDLALAGTFGRRDSVVLAASEELVLARDVVTDPVEEDHLVLDGAFTLAAGQPIAVEGPEHGAPPGSPVRSEVVHVDDGADAVDVGGGRTGVRLRHPLSRRYARAETVFSLNVAPATEGASVGEILGNGDATASGQAFALKHRPLTRIAGPSGAEPQLEVRVDDVAWARRASLYAARPDERAYSIEDRDDGSSVVRFGDGVEGARLPTGAANVRARYRTGLGADGNVRTGQLTTLLSRPLGIASVVNPAPGTGGDDPEPLADARTNAPVTVRTLDRVVSRLDVEDFARAYPGVLKASAAWVATGPSRGVVLTVVGPGGATIDPSVPTHRRLIEALANAGDDRLVIRLLGHAPVPLSIALRVLPRPDHLAEKVIDGVRSALLRAYGIDARELGQGTSVDEVVAIAHRVPGVVAVDVDLLRRPGSPAGVDVDPRIPARAGGLGPNGAPVSAEVLLLADGDLALEVMT
ncbi:putative baseplate assembly protein [uncultured Microbacterium sp.]|uniref:putative baseplate assembly protein n=1 Tax=uncultured Microbacterium sp. TaxID=191216 RepID=UPI00261FCBCE|nr:putative baseplate assembly protein [uncultured Microbacterium sp.]